MSFKIPDKARNAFDGNMKTGGAVELPFPAPAFYIVNGNAQLAALQNFQYFGGWACNVDKLKEAAEHWGGNVVFPIPSLQEAVTVMDNNQQLKVMASRYLTIAPIGMRQYSSVFDPSSGQTRRVAPFTPGARPGLQVLCILGYKDKSGVIFHWGPILLTAKGYQVNHVQKAITNWQKTIKPVIKRMVPDATASVANLFWMGIGTFGQERKQDLVGTGQKKPITPVSAWIPESIDETALQKLYVGDEMAEFMAEISEQAQEWLKAYETLDLIRNAPVPADMNEPPADAYEEDIPF